MITRSPLFSLGVQALETLIERDQRWVTKPRRKKQRSYLQLASEPIQPCLWTRCLPPDGTAQPLDVNSGAPLTKSRSTARCLAVCSIELRSYRHANTNRWASLSPCKTKTRSPLNRARARANGQNSSKLIVALSGCFESKQGKPKATDIK